MPEDRHAHLHQPRGITWPLQRGIPAAHFCRNYVARQHLQSVGRMLCSKRALILHPSTPLLQTRNGPDQLAALLGMAHDAAPPKHATWV